MSFGYARKFLQKMSIKRVWGNESLISVKSQEDIEAAFLNPKASKPIKNYIDIEQKQKWLEFMDSNNRKADAVIYKKKRAI